VRTLSRAVALLVLTGLVAGAVALWDSPVLDLRRVEVGGNRRVQARDIVVASELSSRDHLLRISTSNVAARVEQSPWVAAARVERILPSSVRITVVERTPAAVVVAGPWSYLVDAQGVVLEKATTAASSSRLPVIADLPAQGLLPGRHVPLPQFGQALTILSILPPAMRDRVAVVRAPSVESITIELSGGPVILFGPAERLGDKRFALRAIAAKAEQDRMVLASIDVRVPDRPAVLPE
jgi:cell division protein FtsQ